MSADAGSGAGLPPGWTLSPSGAADVDELADLLRRHELAAHGSSSASTEGLATKVVGAGAATRRQVVVRDDAGQARASAGVHDRAAGRVVLIVVVDPALDEEVGDEVAGVLFGWATDAAAAVAAERGMGVTQLDSGAFADDERQQRWLHRHGFELVRTWWQMSRPVTPEEGEPGAFPPPTDGIVVRRVAMGADGSPVERDLRAVHDVLEESFTDHFNSHEERFDEFVQRLQADPGHRWDHWWVAELSQDDAPPEPVGAVVGSALGPSAAGHDGSYIEYIGVLAAARGRGVARSLLHAVISDAARRGRDRVGLEVDAVNPTGAARLYEGVGFVTQYVTQSWHRDVPVPGTAP